MFPVYRTLILLSILGFALPRPALAQCGVSISGHLGGETTAVAQYSPTALFVARGTYLEFMSLANPSAPAQLSPPRRMVLNAPARKVSYTPGSPRVFVLLENGDVEVGTISTSPLLSVGFPVTISEGDAVDIVADGQIVYILNTHESDQSNSSDLDVYDDASGSPSYLGHIRPASTNSGYDRLVKIGSVLWAGFHDFHTAAFGIEAISVVNPSSPVRLVSSARDSGSTDTATVSALEVVGNFLLMSNHFFSSSTGDEDQLRAINIAAPTLPVWYTPVDLHGRVTAMSAAGNLLRVAMQDQSVSTWNVSNPASLTAAGAYSDAFPDIGQMIAGSSTDYWAAGRAGLMTMSTANPASIGVRSQFLNLPAVSSKVRQYGNSTAVLDHATNTLRVFDYTQPAASQLRGSVFLPFYSESLELAQLTGGSILLACVGTDGSPSGNSLSIIDITNPAAPVTRSTLTGFNIQAMSASGSRLYVMTTQNDLRIYELAVPTAPALRSAIHFPGGFREYTCMASWSNNALAIGSESAGVWLFDTTNATAPFVASTYYPVSNYRVRALAKGNNYLYINAEVRATTYATDTRLESITVSNLAAPVRRWVSGYLLGGGQPGVLDNLAYVAAPAGKFLVGTRPGFNDDATRNSLTVWELPVGFLTNEGIPFKVAAFDLPEAGRGGGNGSEGAGGNIAPSADGSRVVVSAAAAGLYQLAMPNQWAPGFGVEPISTYPCIGGATTFTALASANPVAVTYQWYRAGNPTVALVDGPTGRGSTISGATEIILTISNVHVSDSALYYSVATNPCGSTSSAYATAYLCPGDFNCSGDKTVQDVFDFLGAYFTGDPRADHNGVGGITVQDVFDFLGDYFSFSC